MIGRFTTIDPSADEEDQESEIPYGYVANNVISRTDPDGRIWGQIFKKFWLFFVIIGAISLIYNIYRLI